MHVITIRPENYKYLHYACRFYNAKLFPPQDNGSDFIFCSIQCDPVKLFYVGRMYERMKIEAEKFVDDNEK